jgi:hypothetical protein
MKNKIVSVCLFIFLSTLVACADVSLSAVTQTAVISSADQATLDFMSEERESGMQQGDEIVAAIEKYYSETNRYPDKLDELVPVYLNEIPLTITGERFEYRHVRPQVYFLSFLLQRQARRFACTYMGDLKAWECSGTGH